MLKSLNGINTTEYISEIFVKSVAKEDTVQIHNKHNPKTISQDAHQMSMGWKMVSRDMLMSKHTEQLKRAIFKVSTEVRCTNCVHLERMIPNVIAS